MTDYIKPEDLEPFRSYDAIADALRDEIDRAAAILAASFLESNLERAIRLGMVEGVNVDELFKPYAPLSTFSGKIDIAHAFGIISSKSFKSSFV